MVLAPPFVTGEPALGHLTQRDEILGLLGNLPQATVATHIEVLRLIDNLGLAGSGIGSSMRSCSPQSPLSTASPRSANQTPSH